MRITFLLAHKGEKSLSDFPGLKDLMGELNLRKVPWREMMPECFHGFDLPEGDWDGEDLVVTDSQEAACSLARQKICCVGFQPEDETRYFDGVQMVVQSFEGLDGEFFRCILDRYQGKVIVVGNSDRLVLRESREDDFEALYQISREEGNERYLDGMTGEENQERKAYLAYVQQIYGLYGFGLWTVEERRTGTVVGRCGLSLPSEECDRLRESLEERAEGSQETCLELGYLIGQKYQRRGYGLEAARQALDYAFRRLDCRVVYAVIHADNIPSAALAKKLGFSRLGKALGAGGPLELWRRRAAVS